MTLLEKLGGLSLRLVGIDVLDKERIDRMEGGEHLVKFDEAMFLVRDTWKTHRQVTVVKPKGDTRSFQEICPRSHAGEEVIVYLNK
jgi:hypothetical protein